jgi:hypothetical protein
MTSCRAQRYRSVRVSLPMFSPISSISGQTPASTSSSPGGGPRREITCNAPPDLRRGCQAAEPEAPLMMKRGSADRKLHRRVSNFIFCVSGREGRPLGGALGKPETGVGNDRRHVGEPAPLEILPGATEFHTSRSGRAPVSAKSINSAAPTSGASKRKHIF